MLLYDRLGMGVNLKDTRKYIYIWSMIYLYFILSKIPAKYQNMGAGWEIIPKCVAIPHTYSFFYIDVGISYYI